MKLSVNLKSQTFDHAEYVADFGQLNDFLKEFSQSMNIQSDLRHASLLMFSFKKLIDTLQLIEAAQRWMFRPDGCDIKNSPNDGLKPFVTLGA